MPRSSAVWAARRAASALPRLARGARGSVSVAAAAAAPPRPRVVVASVAAPRPAPAHSAAPAVVVADRLTRENLQALVRGDTLVLRVPGFVSPGLCDRLASYFKASPRREPYTHEVYDDEGRPQEVYLGVDRVGVPFNSTYGHPRGSDRWRRYFDEALPAVRALREAAAPEPTPTDRLRLEFDELLPAGSSVASIEGSNMLCGIGRVMESALSQASEAPHWDALPAGAFEEDVRSQMAANFYLEVPEEGGELEIWPVPMLEPEEVVEASGASEEEVRASLPPSTVVRPTRGDLLLFSTRRPHAIRGFGSGSRTTLQTFFGELPGGRIVLWN